MHRPTVALGAVLVLLVVVIMVLGYIVATDQALLNKTVAAANGFGGTLLKMKDAVKIAGISSGDGLFQAIIILLMFLIAFINPMLRGLNNGIRFLVGSLLVTLGPYLPAPACVLLVLIGAFLLLEFRYFGINVVVEIAVLVIIGLVYLLFTYIPVLAGVTDQLSHINQVRSMFLTLLYAALLVYMGLVAIIPGLDGTRSYVTFQNINWLWLVTGKHPYTGWGKPVCLNDTASLLSGGFGGDNFVNTVLLLLPTILIGWTLIRFELKEIRWLKVAEVSVILLIAVGSVVVQVAFYAADAISKSNTAMSWFKNLQPLSYIPTFALFALSVGLFARSRGAGAQYAIEAAERNAVGARLDPDDWRAEVVMFFGLPIPSDVVLAFLIFFLNMSYLFGAIWMKIGVFGFQY